MRVKAGMKELSKIPSRAVHLHDQIYRNNPEIRAVLQAHPLNAMAFAVTDAEFDARTIPESYILLRDIKRMPYRELYSDPARALKEFRPSCPAIMIEGDCVIVTGDSLLKAFDRLEVLEATAHSIINSAGLGQIVHITDSEIEDLKEAFHLVD